MKTFLNAKIDYDVWKDRQWASLGSNDCSQASLQFLLTVYRFLVLGLCSRSSSIFKKKISQFFHRMQPHMKLFFLSHIWNDSLAHDGLRVISLKMASECLKRDVASFGWAVEHTSFVVPQILCSLATSNSAIRKSALAMTKVLASIPLTTPALNFAGLIREINDAREELEIDCEQLKSLLACYLKLKQTSSTSVALFSYLTSAVVPDNVKHGLLLALQHVNSVDILKNFLPLMRQIIAEGEKAVDPLGTIPSSILSLLLERFSPESVSILTTKDGWETFLMVHNFSIIKLVISCFWCINRNKVINVI